MEHIKDGVCVQMYSRDEVEAGAKVQFSPFIARSQQILSKTEKFIGM